MRKLICLAALAALCACQPMPAATTGTPAATAATGGSTTSVSSVGAAIQSVIGNVNSTAAKDVAAALVEAKGTGTGTAASPYVDTDGVLCFGWVQGELPVWQAQFGALVPSQAPAGVLSAAEAAHIAAMNVSNIAANPIPPGFNTNCGPWVLDNEQAAVAFFGKLGIKIGAQALSLPSL